MPNLFPVWRDYLYEMQLEWVLTPPSCGNRDLVDRVQAGDDATLRDLYSNYGRRLRAFAFRIVGNAGRADDVVQDSFVAAWRTAHGYRGDSSPLAWLHGIVRHHALNAIRRASLRLAPLEDAETLDDGAARPDALILERERAQAVREAIERLPADQRLVLTLVFYEGLSLAETAAACSCPVGTVKSRLHAAKARLRTDLGDMAPEGRR